MRSRSGITEELVGRRRHNDRMEPVEPRTADTGVEAFPFDDFAAEIRRIAELDPAEAVEPAERLTEWLGRLLEEGRS